MAARLKVDIKELITLLGKHLYTTPDVIFRELIQNCYDSIRERYGVRTSKVGRIRVRTYTSPMSIEFSDNGMGMDRDDLDKYLSTIGQGLKRLHSSIKRKSIRPIGEFGIGFYSSFIISDQIAVVTRKLKASDTLMWSSQGIEEYVIEKFGTPREEFGTTVKLTLQRGSAKYADVENVREILKRYCNYIDCPITLNEQAKPLNDRRFPWDLKNRQAQVRWLSRHFGHEPIDFTVGVRKVGAISFGYALSYSSSGRQSHDIYSRRMFVTDRLKFIDPYLEFVELVINCDKLSLNMSREQVIQNRTFRVVTSEIQELILKWLKRLLNSEHPNPLLIQIIKTQQDQFRSLALHDPTMFKRIHPYLLFQLAGSDEQITIKEYVKRSDRIRPRVLFMHQVSMNEREGLVLLVCQKNRIPVILAKSEEDVELLRRICNRLELLKTELMECKDLVVEESLQERESLEMIRRNFERFLGMETHLRRFAPPSLPLILEGDEIILNDQNPYLLKLAQLEVPFEQVRPIYINLYKIFRVLNRLEIAPGMLEEILKTVVTIFENWQLDVSQSAKFERQLKFLSDRWWRGPRWIGELQKPKLAFKRNGNKYYLRCFIACPFDGSYRDVVNVVKDVSEAYGIFAETAEGIDNRDILEKVCDKIDRCDFAVVDVSEVNPNVMLELGLLIARRKPAILIRSKLKGHSSNIGVPADLVGIERIEYSNTSEDLFEKMEQILSDIGGRKHAQRPQP